MLPVASRQGRPQGWNTPRHLVEMVDSVATLVGDAAILSRRPGPQKVYPGGALHR